MEQIPSEVEPGNREIRIILRLVGGVVLGVGVLSAVVGLWSFFSAFGTMQPPRYFWAVFLGFPMIAIGAALSSYGDMGAVARYQVGEMTPVARDTFNTLAKGTAGGVETLARAVSRGLRSGGPGEASVGTESIPCSKCQSLNAPEIKFCPQCGTPVVPKVCTACGAAIGAGARFCGQCGKVVG